GRLLPAFLDGSDHLGQMVEGYDTFRGLASSPQHLIPGHDPLVMARYPAASPELAGAVIRVGVMPNHER
ncbi:MAG: hypothetical protein ACKVVP_20195, partial [Chloroflexota bacterium]